VRIAVNGLFWSQPRTGSGQYLRHLLRALTEFEAQHQYRLVLAAHNSQFATRNSHTLRTPFDHVSENWTKLWFEQVSFPRACRRLGADLAHVPYFGSPLAPSVPTVVTVHDLIPMLLPAYRGSFLVRAYTRLVATAAQRAAAIITDSECSKRDSVRVLGIPAARVHAIPLAAEPRFRPVEDTSIREAVRRRYNLPDEFILYLGGFDQRKNIATLIQAFAQFATRNSQFTTRLVLAGELPRHDTTFTPDPRRLAHAAGMADRVVCIGDVSEEDKPALYSLATLFVYPSLYEGFGLPVLEAMACGTPVVTSKAASLPEIVGDAGLMVAPTDGEALAEAMAQLWRDADLRRDLARRGLERARGFTWQKTAQATLAVYEKIKLPCAS